MRVRLKPDKREHAAHLYRKPLVKIDRCDTFSLDYTLALVIAPALAEFREEAARIGHPADLTPEEWDDTLATMQTAFELVAHDEAQWKFDKQVQERVQRGLDLFAKWYGHLWT